VISLLLAGPTLLLLLLALLLQSIFLPCCDCNNLEAENGVLLVLVLEALLPGGVLAKLLVGITRLVIRFDIGDDGKPEN
jgi:hypothetical protein